MFYLLSGGDFLPLSDKRKRGAFRTPLFRKDFYVKGSYEPSFMIEVFLVFLGASSNGHE
jgi:hypothetical protein